MFKNKYTLLQNRNVLSVLLSALLFLITLIIIKWNILYIFDKKIQDIYFKFNEIKVSNDIVVVEIDEDTLSGRKDFDGKTTLEWLWRFPFDRKYYAKVIDNLKDAWASVVGLDIIFWEKSDDTSDDILSNSIKNAWNVILWLWTNSSWFLQYPYEKFWKYAYNTWYLAPNIDMTTNVVYSITPFSKFNWSDSIVDHFTLAIIKWFYSKVYDNKSLLTTKFKSSPNKFVFSDKIELTRSRSNKNEFLINYTDSNKFNKKSFLDIYYGNFDKSLFKDKIVVIWATAKGIKDTFNTPLWIEYWVYTHVNAINTILTKNSIRYLDSNIELLLIFLLILVSVYFNISKSSYVLIFSNISLISLFILLLLYITIFTSYLLNYPAELALVFILSLALSNIVKYYIENKHKSKLNKALSEYVSEDVANEILSWEWRVNLNWENKEIVTFFSDIEWFTTISEKFSPEDLVKFLREYLTEMSNIIMDEKWFINKYEWDAIMALWWVFSKEGNETYRACFSALKQQEVLKKLNDDWKKRWFSRINARMWIHFWNAIIWNIWAVWRKMEFTALWDSVNLASRLEWVNKFYGTYICVSENIYELEKENFEFRYLDTIRVKWKQNSLKIYELVSMKWNLTKKQEDLFFNYRISINHYINKNFSEALQIFTKLVDLYWDPPSITYKERCEFYLNNPPLKDWDWVWTMTSK